MTATTKFDLNDWAMASGDPAGIFDHLLNNGALQVISEGGGEPDPQPTPTVPLPEEINGRPAHMTNADLNRIADAMRTRILAMNAPAPTMYLRDGRVTRLGRRKNGSPRLETVSTEMMHAHVIDLAAWVRKSEKTGEWIPARPPGDIAGMLIHMPDQRLPIIEYVAETPFFDSSGHLCQQDGYHAGPDCFLHRAGLSYDPVPPEPTAEDAASALASLDDLISDFKWAKPSDRAHWLACIFVPFVRPLILGATPIGFIEAPSHGAGKSLLADIISIIVTGHMCHATTLGKDEESTEKKITSILLEGPNLVVIDNVNESSLKSSGNIAAAVTLDRWKQRKLSTLEMLTIPNRALWLMTGANPVLTREVARRCIRVRIDPGTDRPEDRSDFKYADLRSHVLTNRAALVRAVLVLVQRWISTGRVMSTQIVGSFESWSHVVGGILASAGVAHFLEDRAEMYANNDVDGAEWFQFVAAWYHEHGSNGVTAAQLAPIAQENLGGVLGDGSPKSQVCKLGRALMRMRDKYFGTMRISRGGTDVRPLWQVTQAVPETPQVTEQEEPGSFG